jgi:hypothetical protein
VGEGDAVPVGVGEILVGTGEGVGMDVGVDLEHFSTMNKETISTATNKTATKISILCRLRTCISKLIVRMLAYLSVTRVRFRFGILAPLQCFL